MLTFAQFVEAVKKPSEPSDVMYHVTHTNLVPKIRKSGLKRFQTSNWQKASGGRYGHGEIFAFDHPDDAHRWAGKMDWAFHQGMGTGKISVVKFRKGPEKWTQDTSDPLGQASSKGKWWKTENAIPASQIVDHTPVTTEHIRRLTESDVVLETQDAHGYRFHFLPNTSDHEHTVVATHPRSKDTWDGKNALTARAFESLPENLRHRVVGVANIYHSNVENDDHIHQANQVHGVGVHEKHRRKGVASAMYDFYKKKTGFDVLPSPYQSDDAMALWKARKS